MVYDVNRFKERISETKGVVSDIGKDSPYSDYRMVCHRISEGLPFFTKKSKNAIKFIKDLPIYKV